MIENLDVRTVEEGIRLILCCLISSLDKWLNPLSDSDKHQWLSGIKLVGGVRMQKLSGGEGDCVCVNRHDGEVKTVT